MSKLIELEKMGQSIWLDYIQRSMITSGELKQLIDIGLRGVTSNPAIFEKAIAGSNDYDEDLKQLLKTGAPIVQIYETLAIKDISLAADQLRGVYDSSGGKDGYVSLEVSPELAYETEKTIAEAKRLFETVNRPNVLIKVPATQAGLPAITELIGSGVNVNVTLIFGLQNYKAVADAYQSGLEKLAATGPGVKGGHPIDKVASVASFFVSRVDTAVDTELEKMGAGELFGKRSVRRGNWKLVHMPPPYGADDWQLFDIGNDVGESRDVASQHPEIAAELLSLWEDYAASNNVIIPDWVSGY